MRVAALDKSGDWQFGRGKAGYLTGSAAIAQNVVTRIKCFTNDWFLDVSFGTDWISILGQRDNKARLLSAIEQIALGTFGVMSISRLEVVSVKDRHAEIALDYVDIFSQPISRTITLP